MHTKWELVWKDVKDLKPKAMIVDCTERSWQQLELYKWCQILNGLVWADGGEISVGKSGHSSVWGVGGSMVGKMSHSPQDISMKFKQYLHP